MFMVAALLLSLLRGRNSCCVASMVAALHQHLLRCINSCCVASLVAALLQSLLQVLRESHRSRTVFRKVGGFVYVMSVLVSMEGALAAPPKAPWDHGLCICTLLYSHLDVIPSSAFILFCI